MQLGSFEHRHKTRVALTLEMQPQPVQVPDKELVVQMQGGNLDLHKEYEVTSFTPTSVNQYLCCLLIGKAPGAALKDLRSWLLALLV